MSTAHQQHTHETKAHTEGSPTPGPADQVVNKLEESIYVQRELLRIELQREKQRQARGSMAMESMRRSAEIATAIGLVAGVASLLNWAFKSSKPADVTGATGMKK